MARVCAQGSSCGWGNMGWMPYLYHTSQEQDDKLRTEYLLLVSHLRQLIVTNQQRTHHMYEYCTCTLASLCRFLQTAF